MKPLVLIGGKLALICTVAALVLALVNAVTAPIIKENRARALREGLESVARDSGTADAVIGEVDVVEDVPGVIAVYPLTDSEGTAVGYLLQLVGDGYGGDMEILAGFEPTGQLFAARLMANQETPGLGKKAEDPQYMRMFIGTGGTVGVPARRGDLPAEQADGITGATITFLGVSQAITAGSDFTRSYRPSR